MQPAKKVVFVAGEESGDAHTAEIISELKAIYPQIDISGIGGRHMQSQGVKLISDLARFGVTGLTEVIRHLKVIRKAFNDIKQHLVNTKPDVLVLVDYPGFNLRLARYAKTLGIKVVYYISPQIWAWKAKRIHTIKSCVDHMAVIFPFEKGIYRQAGVPVSFVGHPLVNKIQRFQEKTLDREMLHLPENKKIIALLPGSRRNEIERHLPIMKQCAEILHEKNKHLHFSIPIAGTLSFESIKKYFLNTNLSISFHQQKALEVTALSDCVIVASGTASLECALLKKPMCIIYKASLLTYLIASKVIKVRYLGLCNLLLNKMVVPEFLQYDCTPDRLADEINHLLNSSTYQNKMLSQLEHLKRTLSNEEADCSVVDVIKSVLHTN